MLKLTDLSTIKETLCLVKFIFGETNQSMLSGLRLKLKAKRSLAFGMKSNMETKEFGKSARLKKRYLISEEMGLTFSHIWTQEISRFHLSLTYQQEFLPQSFGTTKTREPNQNVKLDTQSKQFCILTAESNWSISNWSWYMSLQLNSWLDMKASKQRPWQHVAAKPKEPPLCNANLQRMFFITTNGLELMLLLTILWVNLLLERLNSKLSKEFI